MIAAPMTTKMSGHHLRMEERDSMLSPRTSYIAIQKRRPNPVRMPPGYKGQGCALWGMVTVGQMARNPSPKPIRIRGQFFSSGGRMVIATNPAPRPRRMNPGTYNPRLRLMRALITKMNPAKAKIKPTAQGPSTNCKARTANPRMMRIKPGTRLGLFLPFSISSSPMFASFLQMVNILKM